MAEAARKGLRAAFAAAALLLFAGPSPAQILPWEVNASEIQAGRLRQLAERLSRQNLLYQLHLGHVSKEDLIATSTEIDRVLESLAGGSPSESIPAPWTAALREQIQRVDDLWGPLRSLAVASPYDYFRAKRQFGTPESSRGDPLLIRLFDSRAGDLVSASETLMDLYDEECRKTGLEVCPVARSAGLNAMLIERATKEAIYIVAGIDTEQYRQRLQVTVEAYEAQRAANSASPFFAEALNPERGRSAAAAGQLLVSLRKDWDTMRSELSMLAAGDEGNFELARMLQAQERLVAKVERLTAALVRYASVTYGS